MKRPIPLIVGAVVLMPIVAVVLLGMTGMFTVRQLPMLGEVGTFKLEERSGRSLADTDLLGKVWVASFIFTSCSSQCPIIMKELSEVQRLLRFKDKFRLVSITVDPEHDNVPALQSYATQWKADPYKWLFLTGPKEDIHKLVRYGFKLPSEMEGVDLTHSGKLALVDHGGHVRGYYDSEDPDQMKRLIKDTRFLLKKAF